MRRETPAARTLQAPWVKPDVMRVKETLRLRKPDVVIFRLLQGTKGNKYFGSSWNAVALL
jgi:hypothetical protein